MAGLSQTHVERGYIYGLIKRAPEWALVAHGSRGMLDEDDYPVKAGTYMKHKPGGLGG